LSGAFIELLVANPLCNSWWIKVLVGGIVFKPSHSNVQGEFEPKLKLAILPIRMHAPGTIVILCTLKHNHVIMRNVKTLEAYIVT